MIKNNTLLELFVTGKEVTISDGDKEATVWVQKINPNEHESLTRKANAARAKMLTMAKDEESDYYQQIVSDVYDMDKDAMASLVANSEIMDNRTVQAVESELSEKPEWKDEDYLQGLRDAWVSGLNVTWLEDPEDEEANRVYEELKRFTEQIAKEVEQRRKDLETEQLNRDIAKLEKAAIDCKIKEEANIEWLKVFRKGQLVYGVRDNKNRRERILDWNNIDEIQGDTYDILSEAMRSMNVDPIEGKE
jgi:hypothetical protein